MKSDAYNRHEPAVTLQRMDVHCSWSLNFRTHENDTFYKMAFDFIATVFGVPDGTTVLDAGCGSGTKSFQLARRRYLVKALDFSPAVLDEARAAADQLNLAGRIDFAQGDLTSLTIESRSVSRALCWGVLMHIPDVSKAIAELARVLAPGGILIVSEGNSRSLQAICLRWLKHVLKRERAEVIRTQAGVELWEKTSAGRLLTRQADIIWLISEFRRHGLRLVERRAGQFSEIYALLPYKLLRSLVHAFNHFWFRRIRLGGPAFGNILVLERPRLDETAAEST